MKNLKEIERLSEVLPVLEPVIYEVILKTKSEMKIKRLEMFLCRLEISISDEEKVLLENQIKDEEFFNFVQMIFEYSFSLISSFRMGYLASLIKTALHKEKYEIEEFEYLLNLLKSLNDDMVLLLRYYLSDPSSKADKYFRENYKNVWDLDLSENSTLEEKESYTIKKSYVNSLVLYSLVQKENEEYTVTDLGRVFLKYIGFKEHYALNINNAL